MAGHVRPLEELLVEQIEYLAELDGVISGTEKSQLADLKKKTARGKDPFARGAVDRVCNKVIREKSDSSGKSEIVVKEL